MYYLHSHMGVLVFAFAGTGRTDHHSEPRDIFCGFFCYCYSTTRPTFYQVMRKSGNFFLLIAQRWEWESPLLLSTCPKTLSTLWAVSRRKCPKFLYSIWWKKKSCKAKFSLQTNVWKWSSHAKCSDKFAQEVHNVISPNLFHKISFYIRFTLKFGC